MALNEEAHMERIKQIIEKRLRDLNTRGKTISIEEDFLKELLEEYNKMKNKPTIIVCHDVEEGYCKMTIEDE